MADSSQLLQDDAAPEAGSEPLLNAEAIMSSLLGRCDAYCAATKTGKSILSIAVTGSPGYLNYLRDGRRNITIDMAERMSRRLSALEKSGERLTNPTVRQRMAELEAEFTGEANGQA